MKLLRILRTASILVAALFIAMWWDSLSVTSAKAQSETEKSEKSQKYHIAVILPLSGQLASIGDGIRKGIELSYNQLPLSDREKIELTIEDDGFNPVNTLGAYRKLKGQKGVDAVFVFGSPPANALGPVTEKDRTILFALCASDPSIVTGKKFSFIHWVTPSSLALKLTDEIARRNLKRIALVVAEVTGMIADADALVAELKLRGKEELIIYRQQFLKEQTDYKSALARIKSEKADAVVVTLFPGGPLAAFARQFREMKLHAELIGMETFDDQNEVDAAKGAFLGSWYVTSAPDSPAFQELFRQKYQYGSTIGAANGFDAITIFSKAISSGATNSDSMRSYLQNLKNFVGASGTYSASGDNRFTLTASLKEITSKGVQTLGASSIR